jgi:hypothetical protein
MRGTGCVMLGDSLNCKDFLRCWRKVLRTCRACRTSRASKAWKLPSVKVTFTYNTELASIVNLPTNEFLSKLFHPLQPLIKLQRHQRTLNSWANDLPFLLAVTFLRLNCVDSWVNKISLFNKFVLFYDLCEHKWRNLSGNIHGSVEEKQF